MSDDDPKYHLRVAYSCRLVEDNVLSIAWCGYVHSVAYGTYDLSIFLRNVAVAGALCQTWADGWRARGVMERRGSEWWHPDYWSPGCGREVPR